MTLTPNFSAAEFASKCGRPMPKELTGNLTELAMNLQVVRNHVKKPITITSGYRSPEHNLAIGGSTSSYHMKAMAADIKIQGMTPAEVAATLTALMLDGKIKKGGIGLYASWVHYDIRGTHVRFK